MQSVKETFHNRITKFNTQANQLKILAERWTLIRGACFIICITATYFTVTILGNLVGIVSFLITFGGFLYTVAQHQNTILLLKKAKIMAKINENEIKRLEWDFSGMEMGEQFADPKHFYATDLDLFGRASIFQLLNRTHTHAGSNLLAIWMKNPAKKEIILARQEASNELAPKVDFRQNFEMEALISDKIANPANKLLVWIELEANKKINKAIFKYAQFLPIITIATLLGAILGLYTFYFVGLMLLIQGAILKQIDKDVSAALEETALAGEMLKPYSVLLQMIKDESFTGNNTSLIPSLKSKISDSPKAIEVLNDIIHNLSYRTNPAFALTGGILLMWDLRYFTKLEGWKAKHKKNLAEWLDVVSEFETLNSLAAFEFANPKYIKPKISERPITLKANDLGHPMIKAKSRVCNAIALEGLGKTHIITGSNMSGKSTFERTIGVNLTLALMGAVVCADNFECSVMQLFTSMRTQDSLEEDTSSFYAELKRLEQLIILTKTEKKALPTLYFLDEILKGTNSKDRHIGAKALILQLHKANASGFISTHDVDLGDEFEGSDFIKNFSFSSEVNNKGLVFDYKLREGVCHSFNASDLMRTIGIEV